MSEEELLVEHGALYPALQRLEKRRRISAKWGSRQITEQPTPCIPNAGNPY
jgi:DNA-binding PadR family transcriptional regulator